MKNKAWLSILCCLGLLMLPMLLHAEETNAPALAPEAAEQAAPSGGNSDVRSRIKKVSVFFDRALVTRQAVAELSAGDHRLVFDKLPGALETNSVQVRGKGPGLIKGVAIKSLAVAGVGDEDLKRWRKQAADNEYKLSALQDEINQAKKEKEFIEAIAHRLTTATEKSDQMEMDPKKWIEMVGFYRKKLASLDQEIRGTTVRLAPLQEEHDRIAEEIQKLERDPKGKYRVEVWVDMREAGTITLDLDYRVMGPHWYPRYDVRADSKQGTVQIAYRGMIVQNTSEDWRNVEMTLSTAQPQAGGQQPDLTAWRINPYQAAPPPAPVPVVAYSRKAPRAAQKMSMGAMAASVPSAVESLPEPAMEVSQAAVEGDLTALVFNLKGLQTVLSDNQPQEATILVHEFPVVFQYSAIPKQSPRAYLKAKVTNSTEFPLLAGQTSLFLDNNFVANGQLGKVPPTENFSAYFGVDDGIKVEHKLINRKEDRGGMFGGQTRVAFEYQIQITNFKKQAYDITVWDQVPLSGNGDIQVELVEPQYKEDTEKLKKNSENILEWSLRMEPGQTLKIPLKFKVSYPEGMKVQGL